MRELIIDIALLVWSVVITSWYIRLILKLYGKQKSISYSAKCLMKQNKQVLFHLFITMGLCVPLAYLGRSYLTVLGCMMLFGIGVITGFDANLGRTDRQHKLHVILTVPAILVYCLGMTLWSYWYLIPIGIAAIISTIIAIRRKDVYVIWDIEELFIIATWIVVLIHRVILPLIDELQ